MSSEEPENFIDDDGDLFGDDDDDAKSDQERQLSDRELDSGDDEDRNDRRGDTMDGVEQQPEQEYQSQRILDVSIPRHAVPKTTDGELHTLRIPKFLAVDPLPYDSSTFEPPTTDHNSDSKTEDFSANATANTTIRYRKNAETGQLESNAVISRWSDGSATIAVGDNIYELTAKSLAPPIVRGSKTYQEVLDSHQYIATPYMAAELMQVVGHITNQYTVNPNKVIEDVALEKLQSSLAAATRGRNKNDVKDGIALISSNEDPELQKQKAELAEKERMKAQRRREAAAARADQQSGRVRGAIGGGLSLDDLEGRSRATGSRKKRSAPSGPRRPRRRADYDTDDEDVPRGHNREDEYDLEDDFLVGSDEEQEVDDGDESEEELDEESEAEESPKPKKQKTSKSESTEVKAAPDSDIDAEGEDDVPLVPEPTNDAAGGRGRKRHIIEDDEDDE